MTSFHRVALAASALASIAGCTCREGPRTLAYGEPLVLIEVNGVNVETTEVDFGVVPMTKKVTRTVILRNVGSASLGLSGFTKEGEGPAVQLGTAVVEPNPVFGIDFEPFDLPVGESKELTFYFQPPEETRATVPHEVKLNVTLPNRNPTAAPLILTLKGTALKGECDFPSRIDFGAVARGDSFTIVRTLKNMRPTESFARVSELTSADGAFVLTPDSPRGDFSIAPNREKTLTFVFTPTEPRSYLGSIVVLPADGCPEVTTRLVGEGVDNVLSWTPSTLDFGYVPPTITVPGEVTFRNLSFKEVQLTNLATREGANPSSIYRVTMGNTSDATRLTVPAATRDPSSNMIVAGTAKATLTFRPTVLGLRTGSFIGNTDARNPASFAIPLRGFGGGPDIDVLPAGTLNFGRIAYFSGANSAATRRLTVRNVGTRPTPSDPRANLKLGAMGMGTPFTVVAKNAQSSLSEICVGVFNSTTGMCTGGLPTTGAGAYNSSVGIEASGAAATLDIPVRITPANLDVDPMSGNKEWEVTIFSNDPDEPEVRVTITARPVNLPPCRYTITPASLNFGVVTPPSSKDLSFNVCNVAPTTSPTEVCLVTNLDLTTGTNAIFSLPAGAQPERELAPGECMKVDARAWPQGSLPGNPTTVTGGVTFSISDPDPMRAQPTVPLAATLAPSCLVISPNSLDFGTVQQACNSPDRTFTVYNACPQPVRWVTSDLIARGDSAMAGSTNCTGGATCHEFNVVSQPNTGALPNCATGGGKCLAQGGTPLTFQLKYRPLNIGADSGAYRIQVEQGGQQVDYVVTLTGRGDTMGSNVDTFRQDSRPKADILIVIDNSCSMSEEQQFLGTNFNSFIQYAVTSQVDFQIAVTSTDADDDMACPNCITGDFCRVGGVANDGTCINGTGDRIITSQTPNVQMAFSSLVNLGINGSGSETCVVPAVRALTAPKITDPAKNAGFLRPDAVLAVVCVTDEAEQADQPMSFYINQLINIKGTQRSNMFTYNVIGPFTALGPGCSADDQGGRHAQLVQSTNGIREEICTPNWSTALENIGKGAFGFRTTFFLNGTPTAGDQVEVAIDGQILPPRDMRMSTVWRYDAAINAVIFEPLYVPEPGKTLTISYRVACL